MPGDWSKELRDTVVLDRERRDQTDSVWNRTLATSSTTNLWRSWKFLLISLSCPATGNKTLPSSSRRFRPLYQVICWTCCQLKSQIANAVMNYRHSLDNPEWRSTKNDHTCHHSSAYMQSYIVMCMPMTQITSKRTHRNACTPIEPSNRELRNVFVSMEYV